MDVTVCHSTSFVDVTDCHSTSFVDVTDCHSTSFVDVTDCHSTSFFLPQGLWTRFFPAYRAMVEEVNSGALGDIVCVRSCLAVPGNETVLNKFGMHMTGGATLATGVYPVTYVQQFFKDRPEKIVAVGQFVEGGKVRGVVVVLEVVALRCKCDESGGMVLVVSMKVVVLMVAVEDSSSGGGCGGGLVLAEGHYCVKAHYCADKGENDDGVLNKHIKQLPELSLERAVNLYCMEVTALCCNCDGSGGRVLVVSVKVVMVAVVDSSSGGDGGGGLVLADDHDCVNAHHCADTVRSSRDHVRHFVPIQFVLSWLGGLPFENVLV